MNENWHGVSKDRPCPICHHTSWCMVTNDGGVCVCHREPSPRPTRSGDGWIHLLRERAGGDVPQSRPNESSVVETIAAYFEKLPTTEDNLQVRLCTYLEHELGLPREILFANDWRWDAAAKAVAIPMRDAYGAVTGIRYRALKSGAKWAKRGSRDGLFFDPDFVPYDPCELLVCEGPTDAAAAQACGFWTVGRSSCGTGRDLIREFARLNRIRRVTIVADDDRPKPRPGGGTWRPGLEGAVRLAEGLDMPYRIVLPPLGFKDLREWYGSGTLDAASLYRAVQGNRWYGPGKERA